MEQADGRDKSGPYGRTRIFRIRHPFRLTNSTQDAPGAHLYAEDRNFLPHMDTISALDGLVKDVVNITLVSAWEMV